MKFKLILLLKWVGYKKATEYSVAFFELNNSNKIFNQKWIEYIFKLYFFLS
jgi:hypothetical protein